MRLVRNEFGVMVSDKPTYAELDKALDIACSTLGGPTTKRLILEEVMKPVVADSCLENQIDINEILGG